MEKMHMWVTIYCNIWHAGLDTNVVVKNYHCNMKAILMTSKLKFIDRSMDWLIYNLKGDYAQCDCSISMICKHLVKVLHLENVDVSYGHKVQIARSLRSTKQEGFSTSKLNAFKRSTHINICKMDDTKDSRSFCPTLHENKV